MDANVERKLEERALRELTYSIHDWEDALTSADAAERATAALRLMRSESVEHRELIRKMLSIESNTRTLMIVCATLLMDPEEEAPVKLLGVDGTHPYVIFAILQSLKVKRRAINVNRFAHLFKHDNPFVRLALVDLFCSRRTPVPNFEEQFVFLRAASKTTAFLSDGRSPNPVFGSKAKYCNKVRYLRGKCSRLSEISAND